MAEPYDPAAYGDHIAPVYDRWTSELDAGPAVELLAELAGPGGRVLELGVGTGRLALPLAACGLEVVGIEASAAMVKRLREKPGADGVAVVLGDFADVGTEGTFDLAFCAYSTMFSLPSQREQLRCLCNVAAHLVPGAHFVLECFVPDLARFRDHRAVTFRQVLPEGVWIDVAVHDPVEQRILAEHVILGTDGTTRYPVHLRYAWPSELDALAVAAGLEVVDRYEDFARRPFGDRSTTHVSLYRRPPSELSVSGRGSSRR